MKAASAAAGGQNGRSQPAANARSTSRPQRLRRSAPGESLGVFNELRENLIARLRTRENIFPGIIGYEDTVVPQIVNAVLSRQNFILLGLRGQAKSRILRAPHRTARRAHAVHHRLRNTRQSLSSAFVQAMPPVRGAARRRHAHQLIGPATIATSRSWPRH